MALTLSSNTEGNATWLTADDFPVVDGEKLNEMEAPAVITAVAAIGEVTNKQFNSKSNKAMIRFDVKTPSGEVKDFWFTATQSIHSKSNLGRILRRWRGRDFTTEEARTFTLANLLEKQVMVTLLLEQGNNGKTYVRLDTVKQNRTNEKVEPLVPAFIYDYDDPKQANFDLLPKYVQNDISERRGETPAPQGQPEQPTAPTPDIVIDDLPF